MTGWDAVPDGFVIRWHMTWSHTSTIRRLLGGLIGVGTLARPFYYEYGRSAAYASSLGPDLVWCWHGQYLHRPAHFRRETARPCTTSIQSGDRPSTAKRKATCALPTVKEVIPQIQYFGQRGPLAWRLRREAAPPKILDPSALRLLVPAAVGTCE